MHIIIVLGLLVLVIIELAIQHGMDDDYPEDECDEYYEEDDEYYDEDEN